MEYRELWNKLTIDPRKMEIIRKDVLDNVMEMCYADDQLIPGFRQLVKTFARKEKDGAVTELVERQASLMSNLFPGRSSFHSTE